MAFSLFRKSNFEPVILVDIGNGSITGSLTVFETNKKPIFLYVVRRFFTTNEKLDVEKFESEMNSLLSEVLVSIMKEGVAHKFFKDKNKRIKKILISFSSPWFLSKTKQIHLTNEKEFIITKSFIENVIKNEITTFKQELSKEHNSDDFEIVEKSIIHSKINGYVLDNSIGKNTRVFDASIYMSTVSKNFIDKLHGTIHKHIGLGEDGITINTFPLITFSTIRDHFTDESDFILMDVTSEITDITLVSNDVIQKTVSVPSGRNFILRQLAKALSCGNEIAESTLKLYMSKKLGDETNAKVNEVLSSVEKEWAIYLENALLEISPELTLPNSVYITSDGDIADIYIDFLGVQKLDATATFRKNLKVHHINLEKMNSFYENQSGFLLDEFIVMISLFYKRVLETKK